MQWPVTPASTAATPGFTGEVITLAVAADWRVLFVVSSSSQGKEEFPRTVLLSSRNSTDMQKRVAYCCQWIDKFVVEPPTSWTCRGFLMKLGFTCQNTPTHRIRSCELLQNLVPFTRSPCIDIKGVCVCGGWGGGSLSRTRIIGPISFHTTVKTDVSLDIFQGLMNYLDRREPTLGYFQQDRTVCHGSDRVLRKIKRFFGQAIISKVLCEPRSAHFTLPDFFLLSLLNDRVPRNRPSHCWRPERKYYERNCCNRSFHAGCSIHWHEVSCRPVFPGERKPTSVSHVTQLPTHLQRHILSKFCFNP
jgi:hypothetical protein